MEEIKVDLFYLEICITLQPFSKAVPYLESP